MTNDLSNLETLLAAAVEIEDQAEREAWLHRVSAGDSGQLTELQNMVRDYFAAGSLIDRPAILARTVHVGGQPVLGTCIGPYKLRELLGEGGMGSVYIAEQEKPVRRKVAIKVIKPGMDSRQVISRFEAERQALALMDHPNIARVLDAGTTDGGRPYFVMEMVKGLPITEHCDQADLNTRERLELFLQVCRAVQHAHQKGVIHRDLKPSNVMVAMHDTMPVVKVIDFGVAKAIGGQLTEGTLYTGFSQLVGTPLYMSPEQAGQSSLDIDTRSDIYSLGVLLYELLTGTTPFDGASLQQAGFDEMRRIIREVDPPRPSARVSTLKAAGISTLSERRQLQSQQISRQLCGELDWIVMKTLEKDRSRRYESANALANDIEHYLHDEPVEACPPTLGYRLTKLARRNRAVIGTTALVAASLVAGLIGTSWQAVEATRERNRAALAESEAEQETKRATQAEEIALADRAKSEQNLESALAAMDRMLAHASDPALKELPLAEVIRSRMLVDAITFYEKFKTSSGNSPEVRYRAAMVRVEIADDDDHASNENRQAWEDVQIFEQAIRELEGLVNDDPKAVKYRLGLARALRLYALRLIWTIQSASGLKQAREKGITLYEREKAEYVRLVKLDPENAEAYRLESLQCEIYLANAHYLVGNLESARKIAGEVKERIESRSPLPDSKEYYLLAFATYTLAQANMGSNPDSAKTLFREYIELAQGMVMPVENREILELQSDSYKVAATFFGYQGEIDEAKRYFATGIKLTDQLVRDFPSVVHYRTRQYQLHRSLSKMLIGIGEYDEALAIWTAAIAADPTTALFYRGRGILYFESGHYSDALADIASALELNPGDVSTVGWISATQTANCPSTEFKQGMKRLADRAVELNDGSAEALLTRAILLLSLGDLQQALRDCDAILDLVEKMAADQSDKPAARNLASTLNNMSWRLVTSRNKEFSDANRAIELAKRAVELATRAVELAPNDGNLLNTLGVAQYRAEDWQGALESLTKSVDLRGGGDSVDWYFMAMAHQRLDHHAEARQWYDQAVEWMEVHGPDDELLLGFRAEAAELLGLEAK